MAEQKLVEVTVTKSGVVHNGQGGLCNTGTKISVSPDVAKALKAQKLAK